MPAPRSQSGAALTSGALPGRGGGPAGARCPRVPGPPRKYLCEPRGSDSLPGRARPAQLPELLGQGTCASAAAELFCCVSMEVRLYSPKNVIYVLRSVGGDSMKALTRVKGKHSGTVFSLVFFMFIKQYVLVKNEIQTTIVHS